MFAASALLKSRRSARLPAPLWPLLKRKTVLTTRVELNLAVLGTLLLIAVHFWAQPAWAGEPQAGEPPFEGQRTDRPPQQHLGPLARRFQEIIFSDDTRLSVPQSSLHLDQLLHVPEWLHLGLDFRTRYEAYNQPVKKNETTEASSIPSA